MIMARIHQLVFAVLVLAVVACPAIAQEKLRHTKLNVVATFSILGDFARNVGGDRVNVITLVGPNGDTHVYTPSPADARTIANAQVVIVNGFGLEGWLPRLIGSSGRKDRVRTVVATKGIKSLIVADDHHGHSHDHDVDADPHAWQSVANARIYVANIRDGLIAADPAGVDAYKANADAYLAQLDVLDREVRAAIATIPPGRRKVISSHSAFGYFADAYGVTFVAPQGVSTDTEPSARDVASIITQIRKQKIPAIFLENISDPRLMRRIAAETGAKVGETLYSDSLTEENGVAPTYIAMVRHNIKALTSALSS
jgi:zinc/manganese transport system substrate-binding protein